MKIKKIYSIPQSIYNGRIIVYNNIIYILDTVIKKFNTETKEFEITDIEGQEFSFDFKEKKIYVLKNNNVLKYSLNLDLEQSVPIIDKKDTFIGFAFRNENYYKTIYFYYLEGENSFPFDTYTYSLVEYIETEEGYKKHKIYPKKIGIPNVVNLFNSYNKNLYLLTDADNLYEIEYPSDIVKKQYTLESLCTGIFIDKNYCYSIHNNNNYIYCHSLDTTYLSHNITLHDVKLNSINSTKCSVYTFDTFTIGKKNIPVTLEIYKLIPQKELTYEKQFKLEVEGSGLLELKTEDKTQSYYDYIATYLSKPFEISGTVYDIRTYEEYMTFPSQITNKYGIADFLIPAIDPGEYILKATVNIPEEQVDLSEAFNYNLGNIKEGYLLEHVLKENSVEQIYSSNLITRRDFALTTYNNKLYLFGGIDTNLFNDLWVYDNTLINLHQNTGFNNLTFFQLKTLTSCGITVYKHNLYIYLGIDNSQYNNLLITYNLLSKTVTSEEFPISPRKNFGYTSNENKIYIWGGRSETNLLNDFFEYDINTKEVVQLPQTGDIPTPREYTKIIKINNSFVLYGGINNDGICKDIYLYIDGAWIKLDNLNLEGNGYINFLDNLLYIYESTKLTILDLRTLEIQNTFPVNEQYIPITLNNKLLLLTLKNNEFKLHKHYLNTETIDLKTIEIPTETFLPQSCENYFYGGYSKNKYTNDFYYYNGTWNKLPSADNRILGGLIKYKNDFYLIGGIYHNEYRTDIKKFSNNTWSNYDDLVILQRTGISYTSKDNKIYIYGPGNDVIYNFYEYNIDEKQLYPLNSLPDNRIFPTLTSTDKYIFLFGGYLNDEYKNDFWRYDISANTWEQLECPLAPRIFCNCIIKNNYIYFYGGYNGNFLNDIWIYNLDTNTWKQLDVNLRKICGAGIGIFNDKIIIYGGHEESKHKIDFLLKFTSNNNITNVAINNYREIRAFSFFDIKAFCLKTEEKLIKYNSFNFQFEDEEDKSLGNFNVIGDIVNHNAYLTWTKNIFTNTKITNLLINNDIIYLTADKTCSYSKILNNWNEEWTFKELESFITDILIKEDDIYISDINGNVYLNFQKIDKIKYPIKKLIVYNNELLIITQAGSIIDLKTKKTIFKLTTIPKNIYYSNNKLYYTNKIAYITDFQNTKILNTSADIIKEFSNKIYITDENFLKVYYPEQINDFSNKIIDFTDVLVATNKELYYNNNIILYSKNISKITLNKNIIYIGTTDGKLIKKILE